jgi:hypothetical protein
MFQSTRTVTVIATALPAALQAAAETTAYLNKNHSLNMKFGVEQYGSCRIHWQCEFDSLDKFDQLNQKLLKDREYLDMVKRTEGLWVHGSLKDTLVKFPD